MIRSRTLHKWIGIVVGVALLTWVITGIILMLPGSRPADSNRPIAIRRAIIPPAQALAQLGDSAGAVRSVALAQILDHVVYQVEVGRQKLLVNAENGEPFEITPAIAEAIARQSFKRARGPASVELVTAYDEVYTRGDLPAYRVSLGEKTASVSYVSARTGSVTVADNQRRVRLLAHKVHDFSILMDLMPSDRTYRGLVIGTSLVALVGIVTGYWLALPRLRRRDRRTEPMSSQ